jgi:hypothetical protein
MTSKPLRTIPSFADNTDITPCVSAVNVCVDDIEIVKEDRACEMKEGHVCAEPYSTLFLYSFTKPSKADPNVSEPP